METNARPRAVAVSPREDYRLFVTFDNGESGFLT